MHKTTITIKTVTKAGIIPITVNGWLVAPGLVAHRVRLDCGKEGREWCLTHKRSGRWLSRPLPDDGVFGTLRDAARMARCLAEHVDFTQSHGEMKGNVIVNALVKLAVGRYNENYEPIKV